MFAAFVSSLGSFHLLFQSLAKNFSIKILYSSNVAAMSSVSIETCVIIQTDDILYIAPVTFETSKAILYNMLIVSFTVESIWKGLIFMKILNLTKQRKVIGKR